MIRGSKEWVDLFYKMEIELIIHDQMLGEEWNRLGYVQARRTTGRHSR